MKKVCRVCGYVPEGNIKECPNCGSYDFEIIKDKESSNTRFRKFT